LAIQKFAVADMTIQGHSRLSEFMWFDRGHDILSTFISNCGFILHHVQCTATFWSKMANVFYRTCMQQTVFSLFELRCVLV